jgi:hypothetical protein
VQQRFRWSAPGCVVCMQLWQVSTDPQQHAPAEFRTVGEQSNSSS